MWSNEWRAASDEHKKCSCVSIRWRCGLMLGRVGLIMIIKTTMEWKNIPGIQVVDVCLCIALQHSPLMRASTVHDTRLYFRIYRTENIFVLLLWLQLSITDDSRTLADSFFLLQKGQNIFPFRLLWHYSCDELNCIHEEIGSQLTSSCPIYERNKLISIAIWTTHSGNCFSIPLNSNYFSVHVCSLLKQLRKCVRERDGLALNFYITTSWMEYDFHVNDTPSGSTKPVVP